MNPLSKRSVAGLAVVGDDLVVVEASLRGDQARWNARRLAGFFGEGAGASTPEAIAPKPEGVTLVWPSHRTLRRDVTLGEQTIDGLREAVGETPDAFFPVSHDEALLWDAHAFTDAEGVRRALLCAVRLRDIEHTLDRLGAAGLTPTRIVPSGAAWSALRHAFDDAPAQVLERGAGGWSLSEFDGLRWNGLRAGFGAPPAEASDAEGVCDWAATPQGVGESGALRAEALHAEHAALGGALLDLVRVDAEDGEGLTTIDLLRARPKRAFRLGAFGWFAAAAAVLVVSLLTLNNVMATRAERELRAITTEVTALRPGVERVETMRAENDALVAAHDRLATLEASYQPMGKALQELTRVTPSDASFDRIDFADSGVSVRAISRVTLSDLMGAINSSPMFARVQVANRSAGADGVEQIELGFNYAPRVDGASPAAGEGAP